MAGRLTRIVSSDPAPSLPLHGRGCGAHQFNRYDVIFHGLNPQNKVGPDVSALEASLAPIERYALRVRSEVDPFYSLYFRTEAQRREEVEAAGGDLDVDTLEGIV